ncbi:MAG: M20/M25/M40 family metallo-hydrolase [Anaerolineae bacterium]|nr:M20/M25/M40 family metallo-hydrolase [Anaerolineae bacterium]
MSLSNASITRLVNSSVVQNARQAIRQQALLERAIAIQQIPAPTFGEAARAAYLEQCFRQNGLQQVEVDALHNVYGWLPAPDPNAPTFLISAHTDTVFPQETDLSLRHAGTQVYGPGLGDNSLGVAALLTLAGLLEQHAIPRSAHLCFLANSREEGLGDLGGIRGGAGPPGGPGECRHCDRGHGAGAGVPWRDCCAAPQVDY